MDRKKQETLLRKFPLLYYQYYLPMTETCMCWGFDCGDGWYEIIYELSEQLERHLKRTWYERLLGSKLVTISRLWSKFIGVIYRKLHWRLPRFDYYPFGAVQVKEKFGTLCYYTNYHSDELQEIISKYESLSASTCETCGSNGILIQQGWWHVTCVECASESDLTYMINANSPEEEEEELE